MWKEQIKIIDGYEVGIIDKDCGRLADFSNNATVQITPVFEGVDYADMNNVEFNLFTNFILFFYQEFEIPAEYAHIKYLDNLLYSGDSIDLNSFSVAGMRNGNWLKIGSSDLMAPIFDSTWTGFHGNYPQMPQSYVFGSTDSTYLFYSKEMHNQSIDNPSGEGGYIIRSNAYKPFSIGDMSKGQTKNINGVIAFNTTNLIQVYAGKDNKPYTADDIFVYAPKFWERLSINLTSE